MTTTTRTTRNPPTRTVACVAALLLTLVLGSAALPGAHAREQAAPEGEPAGAPSAAPTVLPQVTLEASRPRAPARHVVRYRVETRGRIVASTAVFRRQVQETFDDRRGWRASGIEFRRVATGGTLSVVLSEASKVPTFSSGCSAQWSCRVGRYVVINQMRWNGASTMWRNKGRTLRSYRHMVVNHETGHWLGLGHRGCPRPGSLAPVMMQQSVDLQGCRPNPWPLPGERNVPRF
ncbi:DUF3152 domain-containing protein [Nocardioides sp. HDW12B]|uniref:DUF3152 domain-containing protein n=1 Tax=Nocardioides sp. HDW12B TaxID=2714939 RepID=UPI00140C7883|nr:DUF3152 domain-containing protein [Nocardioides sp. HDW12B]QIK65705.1 DUF3152 domain-containing protein [Nocardioides sp. HDW12B]